MPWEKSASDPFAKGWNSCVLFPICGTIKQTKLLWKEKDRAVGSWRRR
jgi:hypothetical protein